MKEILSEANPTYKLFVKLLSAKKYRQQQKSYLAEGLNFLDTPEDLVIAYLLPLSGKEKADEWGLAPDKLIVLADRLFKNLSADPASQGLIVWIKAGDTIFSADDWQFLKKGLYLALEDIQDAGNLGTMIRTAEAAGALAIFCSTGTVDLYHPKVIKAAASSLSRMKVVTETDLSQLLILVEKNGLFSFAATPLGAMAYDQADYQSGALLLIGNEGRGLSQSLLNLADKRIFIPMSGQIESLNAAVSAAILMFEAKKQLKKTH